MKKVFITTDIDKIAEKILKKYFIVTISKKPFLPKKDLIESVKKYDAILSTLSNEFNEEVLSFSKNLKVISNYAVGVDNIDLKACKKRNIKVFNLPNIVTESTADLTFALLLSFTRKVFEANEYVKKNRWTNSSVSLFLGEELHGKTFGIVGFGRIGKAVAKRALSFGLKVIYFSRSEKKVSANLKKCRKVTFSYLLKSSDFISLHLPLTEKTKEVIDLKAFSCMKKKPILINMARGKIVNTKDLMDALKKKLIRGALLDVSDPEPIYNHPLLSFKNCLIVPHIGTSTYECRYNMAKKAAENILRFFKKKGF